MAEMKNMEEMKNKIEALTKENESLKDKVAELMAKVNELSKCANVAKGLAGKATSDAEAAEDAVKDKANEQVSEAKEQLQDAGKDAVNDTVTKGLASLGFGGL